MTKREIIIKALEILKKYNAGVGFMTPAQVRATYGHILAGTLSDKEWSHLEEQASTIAHVADFIHRMKGDKQK